MGQCLTIVNLYAYSSFEGRNRKWGEAKQWRGKPPMCLFFNSQSNWAKPCCLGIIHIISVSFPSMKQTHRWGPMTCYHMWKIILSFHSAAVCFLNVLIFSVLTKFERHGERSLSYGLQLLIVANNPVQITPPFHWKSQYNTTCPQENHLGFSWVSLQLFKLSNIADENYVEKTAKWVAVSWNIFSALCRNALEGRLIKTFI